MSEVRVGQFPIEAVEGGQPSLSIGQAPVEAVEGGTPPLSVGVFCVEVIHQATAYSLSVGQFCVEAIVPCPPEGDFMPVLMRLMG